MKRTSNRIHIARLLTISLVCVSLPANPASFAQTADETTPELKSAATDESDKKTESMAAYMDGLARQKEGDLAEAEDAFKRAAKLDPQAPEPVKARALLLIRLGKVKQAEELARKAIELDESDYETRLQLALLLASRKKGEEALKLVEEALNSPKLNQKSFEATRLHKVRAALCLESQSLGEAARSLEVVLEALEKPEDFGLDFRQHQAYLNDRLGSYEAIGRVMLQIGRYEQAIRAFNGLAEMKENEPGIHHMLLATAQYRLDELDDAITNLDLYFNSHQRNKESLRLLTDIMRARNESDKIEQRLQQLAEDTSNASTVKLFLGDFLVESGNAAKAAEVFEKVLNDSGDADAHVGLVRVAIIDGNAAKLVERVSKAIRARIVMSEILPLKNTIEENPDFARAVVAESIMMLEDDRNPTSLETFFYSQIAQDLEMSSEEESLLEGTLARNPDPRLGVEVLDRLGFNRLLQGKYKESTTTYRNLLSVPGLPAPQQLEALYRLSQAESFNQNYPEALRAAEKALSISPQNPELTYQLGWIQLQAEDYDSAERHLKAAMKLTDENPSLEGRCGMLLGAVYTQRRQWAEAIETYEQVLDISESSSDVIRRARVALSNAYVQGGDLPNGQRILEDVYQDAPDDPGVNNDLGYLYADQGILLEKAEKMIRLAVEAEPENPAFLDSLGWVCFKLGKYDEALDALEKANSDPDYQDATLLEHLGDVQMKLGKTEAGLESYRKALKTESESTTKDETVIRRIEDKLKPATVPAEIE